MNVLSMLLFFKACITHESYSKPFPACNKQHFPVVIRQEIFLHGVGLYKSTAYKSKCGGIITPAVFGLKPTFQY